MSEYTPDVWVIVKITPTDEAPIYKVLAGWYGGYLNGDSWKLNSGITKYSVKGKHAVFTGDSGSEYSCHIGTERFSMMTGTIFASYSTQLEEAGLGTMEHIEFEQFKKEFVQGK